MEMRLSHTHTHTWRSNWREKKGSTVTDSLVPCLCTEQYICPPKISLMGESFNNAYVRIKQVNCLIALNMHSNAMMCLIQTFIFDKTIHLM